MSIIEIEKQPTWTGLIRDLEVGQDFKAPLSKRETIAPLISRLKRDILYCKRNFETSTVNHEGKDVLKVERLKDTEDEPKTRDKSIESQS